MLHDCINLTLLGLGMDLIGAGIIALPDIPQLRDHHKPGQLRTALKELELNGLPSNSPYYTRLKTELEEITGETIPADTQELFVSIPSVSVGESSDAGIHHRVSFKSDDEDAEPEVLGDTDFDVLRHSIERQIREGEARIRAKGFLLLGSGFALQMYAAL